MAKKAKNVAPEATTPMENRFQFAIHMGERLKDLRISAGVSMQDLASAMGYKDYTALYHLESGRSCLPTWSVPIVCRMLNVSPEQLLGMDSGSGTFKIGTGGRPSDEEMLKADQEANRLIGERLRAARVMEGMTLVEMSDETGLSVSMLSRAENGQRRVAASQIALLAGVLEVTVGQLLGTEKM